MSVSRPSQPGRKPRPSRPPGPAPEVRRLVPPPISHPPMWRSDTSSLRVQQPLCVRKVYVTGTAPGGTPWPTTTMLNRQRRARQLQIPVDQCGRPATHRVGKKPYCKHHAGDVVLEALGG